MDTATAQNAASLIYNSVTRGGPSIAECPNVISKAREIYQRIRQPVTIVASRNGVYRYTFPIVGSGYGPFAIAGAPDGTLGQIETFEKCFANSDCDACWREQFAEAQRVCNPGSDDYDQCVEELARQLTRERCFPNFGGTGTRINAYPWQQVSNETCLHQDQVNAVLRDNGYQTVDRDCRLGPLTCGASSVATQIDPSVGIPDTCFAHQSEWVLPQKGPSPPPAPAPAPTPLPPPAPTASKGMGAGGLALLAAAVLAGIYAVTQVA
jgi:hypothetical protein